MSEENLTCWICEEHETCPYPVCTEMEQTEHIKREEQLEIELDE